MKKKILTIEDLAIMTQNNFSDIDGKIGNVREDINGIHDDIGGIHSDINEVNNKLSHIQNLLIRAQDNRLDKIEDDIRVLKTLMKQK